MNLDFVGKRDIVVYGAGSIASFLLLIAKEEGWIGRIKGIVVTTLIHTVLEINGVKVYKAEDFLPLHRNCFVLLAVRNKYVNDIITLLKKQGCFDYSQVVFKDCISSVESILKKTAPDRYNLFIKAIDRTLLSDEEYIMFLSKQLKSSILNFEVNLVDHCNLNCQCCNHFSPLSPQKFLDLDVYENDIKRISELYVDNRGTLMLLGGEPLLHPNITDIIRITREYLPNMTIDIVTNGLLLKKMDENFWAYCHDYRIDLQVTKYPLNFDYASLVPLAKEKNVNLRFCFDSMVTKTLWRLPILEKGDMNPYKNYAKCYHANLCVTLKEGRLYTCPIAANINILNNYFNKRFPQGDSNSIDIYKVVSAAEIEDFLKRPCPLCRHCDVYAYEYDIPWSISRKNITEWIVENG